MKRIIGRVPTSSGLRAPNVSKPKAVPAKRGNANGAVPQRQKARPISPVPELRLIPGQAQPKRITSPVLAAPVVQWFTVSEDDASQRLDNFLFRHLKGVPKSHVYQLISSGQVRVNKARSSAQQRLQLADVVRIPPVRLAQSRATQDEPSRSMAPPKSLPVIYEDELLLAIHKPAGMAVHGGSGVSWGVIECLRSSRPHERSLELVHRLDRETSGVLLLAKRRSALRHLQAQFRERETNKVYLALVKGPWPERLRVIDKPLYKYVLADGERRVRVTSPQDPEGMRALTLVQVRQRWAEASLLEVVIKTGRTHQIRVHLADAGCPILGDDKYGDFDCNKTLEKQGLKRMFLHAWRLGFAHPKTGQTLQLEAPLAEDLSAYLATLEPTG